MMSNLNSKNKLTEFPPLEPEEKPEGIKFSVSRFMFWKKNEDVPPRIPDIDSSSTLNSDSDDISRLPQQHSSDNLTVPLSSGITDGSFDGTRIARGSRSTNPSPDFRLQSVTRKLSFSTKLNVNRTESSLSNPSPELLEGNVSPFEARTLPNVLRRISNLIAMGSHNQNDMRKYWMPDSVSKECYDCGEKFTTFRRKHHCRICGQIFCSRCCNQEIPGKIIGYSGDLRVCTYCCKIVLSYLNSADLNTDLTNELKLVQEDLQSRFGGNSGSFDGLSGSGTCSQQYGSLSTPSIEHIASYRSLPRRKASLVYQEERFVGTQTHETSFESSDDTTMKTLGDWVSIKALWDDMCHPVTGVDWSAHRHNSMKNHTICAVGSELVDWLLAQRKISWRGQGVQIGQLLLDVNLIECVSQVEQVFLDAYALYRPLNLPLASVLEDIPESGQSARSSVDFSIHGHQDPLWMKQINMSKGIQMVIEDAAEHGNVSTDKHVPTFPSSNSLYSLELNTTENIVTISKPKERHDPYDTQSQGSGGSTKTTPKGNRKQAGGASITSETMTDEFLQNTLLRQNEQANGDRDKITPAGWHLPQQLTTDEELMAFQLLCNAYIRHENELLGQLLERVSLPASWADIILPIIHKVTEIVRPDVKHADDDMDIRHYVQFKKIPGSRQEDSRIVNGVVCSKNVAHRKMKTKFKAPRILLIGSSIDYQRFENRFLSLEPLVMQENDYLKNTVSRICSLSPNIVLVEKSVSRLAQEFLLDLGITLVLNVKSSVMERVARFTQGVIESSADTPIGRPQLGLCHHFYLESFKLLNGATKTLMFFDGCATHLGCTVLLRGGSTRELTKVKKIMSLMILVAYNWRLERSFHIDLFAKPPDSGLTERDRVGTELNFVLSPDNEDVSSYSKVADSVKAILPVRKEADTDVLEKIPMKTEVCDDLSDPLQSEPNPVGNTSVETLSLVVEPVKDPTESNVKRYSFKKCLEEVILSASPFIDYTIPYLETEEGKKCQVRSYFPDEIYWSSLLYGREETTNPQEGIEPEDLGLPKMNAPHPFVFDQLSAPIESDHVQGLLADYRRKGQRFGFISPSTTDSIASSEKKDEDTRSLFEILGSNENGRIDALDPFKHQKLSVLFCSFSPSSCNFPSFCVHPWVFNMDMYGRNDISLGMFMERYCFRKSYPCPSKACDQPMISSHIRRFVHGTGCITVVLKELPQPISGASENILMWNWCSKCESVSPIVPMSSEAWSLSFAKYLELRFQGHNYIRRGHEGNECCPHSLHHENVQYFAQDNIVCCFKHSEIRIWEVSLPVTQISVNKVPRSVEMLVEDVKTVAMNGHGLYGSILEILVSLREHSLGLKVEEVIKALLEHLKAEQTVFRSRIEDIQINLTSPDVKASEASQERDMFLWKVTDSIGFLRSFIVDTVPLWNSRLQDAENLRKKEEKQAKTSGKTVDADGAKLVSKADNDSGMETVTHASSNTSIPKTLEDSTRYDFGMDSVNEGNVTESTVRRSDKTLSGVLEELSNSPVPTIPTVLLNPILLNEPACPPKNLSIPLSQTLSASCPPSPYQSAGQERVPSKIEPSCDKPLRSSGEYVASCSSNTSEELYDSKGDRKSNNSSTVKTLMAHFITASVSGQLLQSPFGPNEHHFQMAITTMPIVVYEYEPSSLVAFALCSNEYQTKRMEMMKLSPQGNMQLPLVVGTAVRPSVAEDSSTARKSKTTEEHTEDFSACYSSQGCTVGEDKIVYFEAENDEIYSKGQSHIEVQFSTTSTKFYCRVYFAEKFRQLRKMVIAEGEEFYIRSISRCVSWAASGGKSGSTFCKTLDDRFVIKQMSKFEIESFVHIAPKYFNYLRMCYQEKKPTVLAKIVGVYRIGFKNSQNNAASKQDILVMENLFYQRQITQKFDLKGSIRNRLATASAKVEDLVLLDENLVNMACENPIYIRPHTKTVLTMAITNDSKFLASQMVMDYSLLVGLDEKTNELVVGIIDYIRTFTWDKKIEAFVKSSGLLGGQGRTPTVIQPEEYQFRFCEAMYRYFHLVPNRWMGLGHGIDS